MPITRTKTVINRDGLALRPTVVVIKKAAEFKSTITLRVGERTANAKNIMGVLGLVAYKGIEVEITAEGPDEEEAMKAMEKVFDDKFGYRE